MRQEELISEVNREKFEANSAAAKVLVPLLDALHWQGDKAKMLEALADDADEMDLDGLAETLANLNFKCIHLGRHSGKHLDPRILPILVVRGAAHFVILSLEGQQALVYDGVQGIYRHIQIHELHGTYYGFKYAEDMSDALVQPQNHWFGKLVYRFRKSFLQVGAITLILTLLDLLLPLFVVLIYDRLLVSQSLEPIFVTGLGVLLYMTTSYALNRMRSRLLNYISTRMGHIISQQTFTRLIYLSPSYTETASINAQIARIKDFEGIKRFVISGSFVDAFDLLFSVIYIIAIFILGGWIGVIPVFTLLLLIMLGVVMRPFHKIKMEKLSETSAQRQQNLIEILRNTDDIKMSGSKTSWLERSKTVISSNILSNFELSDYVSTSNNLSYLITNASVLFMIYGGVLQVFNGLMSTGTLIGVLMLYWKVIGPIRSAFSLAVQINGFVKSVAQINRFMKLPQDTSLKSSMTAAKSIRGQVKFTDVSIRYNNNSNPALFNVSFSNEPGQILGITGHDGAGKTTVLKLILGMYKPQGGRIVIDNVNIKQLEPLSLRRSISYAPDKDILLSGSIRDQFLSYNPGIKDADIEALLTQTGMDEAIKRKGFTLDTHLSESMIRSLPHAFKKRLNLTRMLAREAKLYLIDEPENHLDKQSIAHIKPVIEALAKQNGASVIISTKDEQFLSICDNVLMLNQGRARAKA